MIIKENNHHLFLNKIFSDSLQGNFGVKFNQSSENCYLNFAFLKYFSRNFCLNVNTNVIDDL